MSKENTSKNLQAFKAIYHRNITIVFIEMAGKSRNHNLPSPFARYRCKAIYHRHITGYVSMVYVYITTTKCQHISLSYQSNITIVFIKMACQSRNHNLPSPFARYRFKAIYHQNITGYVSMFYVYITTTMPKYIPIISH
jgi:hypothetical protein